MPCPPLSPNESYFLYPEPDVQVTKSFPGQPRSESVVVANPKNPHHLICTSKKFTDPGRYHGTISTSFSLDGGKTWKESQPDLGTGWDGMTDPDLAFDAAGTAYLIVEPLRYPPGEWNTIGIYVYKSTDGGATWHEPVKLHHDTHDDKMWIESDTSAVSPFFGGMIDATFIGEYFGCAGAGQSFATVWTDTRTDQQELFYDNVVIRGATIPPLARKRRTVPAERGRGMD